MSEIILGTTTKQLEEIKSFSFHNPAPGPASIIVVMNDGAIFKMKGANAVTLKVQLASLGIPEIPAIP